MANLSRRAASDVVAILKRTAKEWGRDVALELEAAFTEKFEKIFVGIAQGHTRLDAKPKRPLLFENMDHYPFVIAFEPRSRRIVRVIYAGRNMPDIFRR